MIKRDQEPNLRRSLRRAVVAALIAALGMGQGAAAEPSADAPPKTLPAKTKSQTKKKKKAKTPRNDGLEDAGRPLSDSSFEEILRRYTFVGDFSQKEAEREVSDELFWRYPFTLPEIEFPLEPNFANPKIELPATRGDGRAVDHLNRGRVLFLEGKYPDAKATWLSGRARYGREYPFHRRNDYFIGYTFMQLALADMKERGVDFSDSIIKNTFANAATFLSWAFIVKEDDPDPLVAQVTPKGLYNLAAIYWTFGRYAGAYGAVEKAMNFLRRTGRKEYRVKFRRMAAEAFIKNRTYLEAVQELDAAIRQDPDPKDAAAIFARVGDIYFDLNNYDLAEDAYALGAKIDEDMRQINPAELVLRGESLFWLGKFSESQKMLHFALEGSLYRKATAPMPEGFAAFAALRIADGYLARKEFDKARLEYFKVGHEYRGTAAEKLAKIREACLDLPFYQGKNVQHARDLLEEAKGGAAEVPAVAQELAWACQVGSYTERERTAEMLGRVRDFAGNYPESRFLKSFAEPVRAFQSGKIDDLFKAGDSYRAISFFEKNRKLLFPKVSDDLARHLFVAYVDAYRSDRAAEFWDQAVKKNDGDLEQLRSAAVTAEMIDLKGLKSRPLWQKRGRDLAAALDKRAWTLSPDKTAANYLQRVSNSSSSDAQLVWMQRLAKAWGQKQSDYVCDLEYPLLSRMFEKLPKERDLVTKRVTEVIDGAMPALFGADESCALSLLDLEARALRGEPAALAARYVRRQSWPLVGGFLHTFWTVSEHLNDDGDAQSARKMWQVLKDKGPAGTPEVQFAKARLDPAKTEFEKLWN